jgi:hypothetical protein
MVHTNDAGLTIMVSLDSSSHSVGPFSGFWSDTFVGNIVGTVASFDNVTTGATLTGSFSSPTQGSLTMNEGGEQIPITLQKMF